RTRSSPPATRSPRSSASGSRTCRPVEASHRRIRPASTRRCARATLGRMTIYRFGAYRLDTAARELRHHDRRLDTSPRALECLLHLLANRDRAVGRDELVAAVWGRESISDNLLGKTLLKARRLVGDNGDAQEVVRTIPRFGYRWVADVEVVEATEDAGRTAASAATASSRPP